MEVISSWADGWAPEGDSKDLPPELKAAPDSPSGRRQGEIAVNGEFQLTRPFTLDGLVPVKVPEKASFQITAELPDGSIEPLLWVEDYQPKFAHAFLLRTPLELPKGSIIHGVPPGASLTLLPTVPDAAPETAAHTE